MKRTALLVTLILFVTCLVGFLALLAIDMRSSHRDQSSQSSADRHARHDEKRSSESTSIPKDRRAKIEPCSNLGVTCASQYFTAWTKPADGSCQTRVRDGYPEPDPRCTPGGIVPGITVDILRNPSWRTKCIRNCQSSEVQKRGTYIWYGLPRPDNNTGQSQTCELDHLVPLELGGADGMGNIWPQCGPADVAIRERYFKQKDLVENYLAARVRSGNMPLEEAQRGIASDWVQYLNVARAHCRQARCDVAD